MQSMHSLVVIETRREALTCGSHQKSFAYPRILVEDGIKPAGMLVQMQDGRAEFS